MPDDRRPARAASLHTRLLAWLTAALGLVIVSSGAAVCWATWRSAVAAVDADLEARAAGVARALQPIGGGGFDFDVPPEFRASNGAGDTVGAYYVLFSADGRVLDRSDPDIEVSWPAPAGLRTRGELRERVLEADGVTIVTGRTLAPARRDLYALAGTIATVGAATLALAFAGGRLLVRRALAPLERMGRTARAMTDGDLDARIDRDRLDAELDDLARALNDAFTRLSAQIAHERRFTADASHELRTPLATMGAEVEWALARPRSDTEHVGAFLVCRRAITRMSALVESLLNLARADAGQMPLARADVALDTLVRDAASGIASLAERKQVQMDVESEPVSVEGDADRLTEAVTNLLVNAVQYNREGGRVDVSVRQAGGEAIVAVRDSGAGIADTDLPHIFERFYRADPARASDPGGVGLGLAWARWVADSHGGSLDVESVVGRGSTFTLRLPARPA